MALVLSAPKVVLLAAQLAAQADIDSLAFLASQHSTVLRKELLLRILLTYLPANVRTADYLSFLQDIETGEFAQFGPVEIDCSRVDHLCDEEASKKVRKLGLQQLSWPNAPEAIADDPLTLFLVRRAHAVDEGSGSLTELPELVTPFLDRSPFLGTWFISALLPLLRRNCEYHPEHPMSQTLAAFQDMPDRVAVIHLLSQTGAREEDSATIGRDLRGLIGPWLLNDARWTTRKEPATDGSGAAADDQHLCPGWEQVLQWLTAHAAKSWRVAANAMEQWDGPGDVDLGSYRNMWLDETEQMYLERRFARAALATAYLIPEASVEALTRAHNIATKVVSLLGHYPSEFLPKAATLLSPVPDLAAGGITSPQHVAYLRNGLLDESNVLTSLSSDATQLLCALVLSAFLLTRAGSPCTVRRAGELAILQIERDQKAEATKLMHSIGDNGPKSDDKYWIRMRNEIMWLRDWGADEDVDEPGRVCSGVLGQVSKEFLEVEILKTLLGNTRYSLARALYEDSPDLPLPKKTLQDTIFASAMHAYDNASNPNRTRGGLKKCDDIIHAFPKTVEKALVATQRIEALLKATHALSDYRLVLKQGEPFTPVVLRVHPDPIAIVGKVLEQNPKSYTKIQDLLDLGASMVEAGLTVRDKHGHSALTAEQEPAQRSIAGKRITAMCIDAALTEDDFETAYSYVVNRLAAIGELDRGSSKSPSHVADEWSWKAALQAGKYKRTERTARPTHLGTASGNPEIRHLEQRIECLSTALRVAPPPTLQEILNTYRRCEEELDAAIAAEAAQENAWDEAAADLQAMPGAFRSSTDPHRVLASTAASAGGGSAGRQHGEEAPLSLFDLSRATARAAQRNFSALSSLQRSGQTRVSESPHEGGSGAQQQPEQQRVRKRDQLRDAAVGTLTSGVGWLIGAHPVDRSQDRE